jgi:histidine decarboxylase
MRRDQPAIFFLNIGTTMKEAVDSLDKVKGIIRKLAIKDYYIHCDAALLGTIAPFLDPRPKFDFQDGVDSVSISGHKFIGSPIPCGIVLTKKEHKERVGRSISYVGTKDTTITGSRNGLSPLFLWYSIKTLGLKGLKTRVERSLDLSNYLKNELLSIGVKAWTNPNAITVVFEKPSSQICDRFQLAVEDDIAHVICVPGITKEQIDDFIDAIRNDTGGIHESSTPESQSFFEEFFVKELLIGTN